jgi:streptogramin lyase
MRIASGVASIGCAALLAGCGGWAEPIGQRAGAASTATRDSLGKGTWEMFRDMGPLEGIVRTPDGAKWVADGVGSASISHLTPAGTLRVLEIGYSPLEITTDDLGDFWVTISRRAAQIVRISQQRVVTAYPLGDVADGGIIFGGDGNIWFAEEKHVGRLTPEGKLTEFATGETQGETGLAWTNGLIWFRAANGLASLDPKTAIVKKYQAPIYQGGAIVVAPDKSLWCVVGSSDGKATLVRFDPKTDRATTFKGPDDYDPYGAPADAALAPDGALWYATQHIGGSEQGVIGGGLVRFDLQTKHFTVYPSPNGFGWQWDLTVAPDGGVWATSAGAVVVLNPQAT